MDPKIWSELPYDLLESIASFADIDSRRALGFRPRKLPPMDLPPFRPNNVIFKYITETRTLIYLEISGYEDYYWDIKTDMIYDTKEDKWNFGPESMYHTIFAGQETEGDVFYTGASYQMNHHPEFV